MYCVVCVCDKCSFLWSTSFCAVFFLHSFSLSCAINMILHVHNGIFLQVNFIALSQS